MEQSRPRGQSSPSTWAMEVVWKGRCLSMHDMKPELSLLEEETGDHDGSRDVLGRVSKWEKGAHKGIDVPGDVPGEEWFHW